MSGDGYERSRCGHLLSPLIATVSAGASCPECGRYGFSDDEPAFLYLATHAKLAQHKVGIGNVVNGMGHVQSLIADGWSIYGLWHTPSKRESFAWEKAVFQAIDTPGAMGQWVGGWARTIDAKVVSASSIAKEVEKIISTSRK